MDFERLFKASKLYQAAFIFCLTMGLRMLLDAVFRLLFGLHSVMHIETWFYVGVLRGTHMAVGGYSDPTVWLLRAVGLFLPNWASLYGVLFSSAALASLTAVLIFLLLSILYGDKTGLIAGVVYGCMVQPLALSLTGFTHDHLQLPLILLALIFAVKAVKSNVWRGIVFSIGYVIVTEASKRINNTAMFGIMIAGFYVGYALIDYIFAKAYRGRYSGYVYPTYISIVLAFIIAYGSIIFPYFLLGSLEALPQGRMGSADILPVTFTNLWLRYNILCFLIPFGLVAAYRRRDIMGVSFTIIGLLVGGVMDRGTRLSDIGFAILFAYALADLNVKYKGSYFRTFGLTAALTFFLAASATQHMPVSASAVMILVGWGIIEAYPAHRKRVAAWFEGRNLVNVVTASAGCGLIFLIVRMAGVGLLGLEYALPMLLVYGLLYLVYDQRTRMHTTLAISAGLYVLTVYAWGVWMIYPLVFLLGGAAMLYYMLKKTGARSIAAVMVTIVLVGFAANLTYIFSMDPKRLVSEGDYKVLDGLRGHNIGGRILTAWDYGYMAEVVSGLKAVSTAGLIDYPVHDVLWMPDRQSAMSLRKMNVSYVLIKSENFNVVNVNGELMYRISGGLLRLPNSVPPLEYANVYAIHKLRQKVDDRYFRLIANETDHYTGVETMLYEVVAQPTPLESDHAIIGGVAVNFGPAKTVRVMVPKTSFVNGTVETTYYNIANESFSENEVREIAYPVTAVENFTCSLTAASIEHRPWSASGVLTYVNSDLPREVKLEVYLLQAHTMNILGSYESRESFASGEKKTVKYYFPESDGYMDYKIAVKGDEELDWVKDESTNPQVEDVRFPEVFC